MRQLLVWRMECLPSILVGAVALASLALRPVVGQIDEAVPDQRGLFPHIFNLATRGRISVNATCGERGPQTYCKLVEHVPNQSEEYPQCRTCNMRSVYPHQRHPIWNAIDGSENWWQSPSIANGMEYHWVTITLDLGQIYQVAYVIVKAANSPRPGNWILERSLDGEMYKPWQYFAISDSECVKHYGVAPSRSMHHFERDDEVTCTSLYSKLEPMENGEIHTSIINGRPSAENPSPVLLEFTSARFIRMRLQQIRTLHADLMTFNTQGIQYIDPIVSRRYYYSIKDISVGGQCICFGHAQQCVVDPDAGPNDMALKCICEHNTCGDQCNECCPGYHQKPWRPGNTEFSNICEACNCHGHAEDCYYDPQVDLQGRSLNVLGRYEGGGVCLDCRDNTAGLNCETCRDGFYRPLGVEPDDPLPCRQCYCSTVGSRSDSRYHCVKDDSRLFENLNPGDCFCKEGYAGPSCDRCARGYRGYPNCQKCACSDAGSINEDPCEPPCLCKEHVEGENCDICKPGFFNLAQGNVDGCVECFCFGITTQCSSVPWGVDQVTTLSGWFVTNIERSSYAFPDTTGVDMLAINHYKALEDLNEDMYFWFASREYVGNKLASHGGYLSYTVSYSIHRGDPYHQATRDIDVVLEGDGVRLYQSFLYLQPEEERTVQVHMVAKDWFVLTPEVDPSRGIMGERSSQEQFMSVLSDVRMLLIRASYNTRPRESRLKNVRLDVVRQGTPSQSVLASVEQCACPPTYEGLSCESCEYGYRRVNNALLGGQCERCDCNNHSPECDAYTGECLQCDHNTYGPHCELCLHGYYGDPTSGLADACQPCTCPGEEQSLNFSPTCVMDEQFGFRCDHCAQGHDGARCERCVDGYFGDPMITGGSCRPCNINCHGNLDITSPGSCDTITGACLVCGFNTAGEHCENCAVGFYGDATTEIGCQACQCHETGALSSQCDEASGSCLCHANVTGQRCDSCLYGHYNISSGEGCQACECDPVGSMYDYCDVDSGQCRCKPGVTGRRCDQCQAGHWNFGESGCQSCQCEQTGGLCDPQTGQCGCPPNVMGLRCDICSPGTWGYNPMFGCKTCNCSEFGSSSQQCDPITGQCRCYKNYGGRQCYGCGHGYYSYPKCRKCRCSRRGRDPVSCQGDLCGCDDEGNCICKENIKGKKCNKCAKGSFSLQPNLPAGCTSCFCFGITGKCTQADYIANRIEMTKEEASELFVSDDHMMAGTQRGVTHYPSGASVNLTAVQSELMTSEVYWNLPQSFLGNKVTAYGGMIKYKIDYQEPKSDNGWSDLRPYLPHIMIVSNLHSLQIPIQNLNGKARPKLELLEHNFKHQGSNRSPSRSEFMMVLRDIQAILIPASQSYQTLSSRISGVYMEVGVPRGNKTAPPTILGLEECKCPKGYRGTSCEECMAGFVRVKEGPYLGRCELCTCHRHSDVCDDGSGHCQDCQHNTTGSRCHLCAPGFYGDATRGRPDDCQPCACPLQILSNNFSPTCRSASDGGYICTACPRGYTGRYCERCANGYFGDPSVPNGACQPCGCNEHGSESSVCDKASGQCPCLPGVGGRSCDECGPREVVVDDGCQSCNDGCTAPLFDALDEMRLLVDGLNITRFVPPPWPHLTDLFNQANDIQEQIDSYKRAVVAANELIGSLPNGTNDLRAMARRLIRKLEKTTEKADFLAANASAVLDRASALQAQFDSTQMLIRGTADYLRNLVVNEGLLTARENAKYIARAQMMLEEMRRREFSDMEAAVSEELRLANLTLQKTANGYAAMLRALYRRIGALKGDLSQLILKLEDLLLRCRTANKFSTNAMEIIDDANETCAAIMNITDQVQRKSDQSKRDISEADSLLDAAEDLLAMVSDGMEETRADHSNLTALLPDLRTRVGDGETDLDELTELTEAAVEHANNTLNESRHLQNLLLPTQRHANSSLQAVRAYSDILAAIDDAHNASVEAMRAADRAHDKVFADGGESIVQQAKRLKEAGEDQLAQTAALNGELESMVGDLATLRGRLNATEVIYDRVGETLAEINAALPPLEEDITTDAERALNVSMAAEKLAESARNKAEQFIRRGEVLKSKVDGLGRKFEEYVNMTDDIQNSVEGSAGLVDEIGMKMNHLRDQALGLNRLEAPIRANLSQLRDKIQHARTEASRISVALVSKGDCARTYSPPVSSSAFNALTLNINVTSPDNLVFYVGSPAQDEYLIVETVNGQVKLSWNLGAGKGNVTHPSNVTASNDWYRIEIQRFSNTASLKVEDSSQVRSSNGTTVTGSSPVGKTILDIREDSNFFLAGIPSNYSIPEVAVKTFKGCMGEVTFDDVSVGLWNFKTIEGNCEGCFKSPVTETIEPGAYFDGTGYTAIPQPLLWDGRINALNFEIKTLAENALLFFSASQDQSSLLSIEMESGRLAIKHDLGDGIGILVSERRINNGEWHAISINRIGQINNLFINSVSEGMSKSPGEATNLQVTGVNYVYVAGVPSDYNIYRNVTSQRFRGCLRRLFLFRGEYPLVHPGRSFGVTHGCMAKTERSVGLAGFGFLTFRPIPLGREADVTVTFRTLMPNCTIFAAGEHHQRARRTADPDATDISYAVGLVDGRVVAQINNGQGRLTLSTKREDGSYNNGSAHTIILTKKEKRITLLVNDRRADRGRLLGTETFINAMSPFYIGTSSNLTLSPEFSSLPSFSGCIENLVIMAELMGFEKASRFENASIGSCGPLTIPPTAVVPTPLPPDELQHCYNARLPAMATTAGRFGSFPSSHIAVDINPEEVLKVFEITIELKTVEKEGLIFYMANSNEKYSAALQLMNGFLLLYIKIGNSPTLLDSDFVIDDGLWHTIEVSRNRKTASLQVDGTKRKRKKFDNGKKRLNIESPIYIGGLPPNKNSEYLDTTSFDGCIRKFQLNTIEVDLTTKSNNSYGVFTCYTNVESGNYFQGIGHALLAEDQTIGANFEFIATFRTTLREGVLFAGTNPDGVGISLQLVEDQVLLKLFTGRRMADISFGDGDNFTVCDHEWHTVLVMENEGLWKLSVDGVMANNLRGTLMFPEEERYSFFVGGNPLSDPEAVSFKGCIRRLTINGVDVAFESSEELLGVVPHECPVV